MSLKGSLAVGTALFGMILVACAGGVSLGDTTQPVGGDPGTTSSGGTSGSSGGTSGQPAKDCTGPNACGPALGMPAEQCPDGSMGGNTGRCLSTAAGGCAWEVRQCPAANACFDKAGELDAAMRTCIPQAASPMADCVVVTFQSDCCGTSRAVGVHRSSQAAAEKCGSDRAKSFPACECATRGTIADDGSISQDSSTATVTCTAAGRCETTFKPNDPCAGQTLPACPRECARFPETGTCTAGDKCRLAGSKIGDECSCENGTWACQPHPPLGAGCNLVCR